MGLLGEAMGISILKVAVVGLTVTTIVSGGYGFYQKEIAKYYQTKYEQTKKELDNCRLDQIDMIDAFKTGDNQVDIMRKHAVKIIENCKEILRKDEEP